VKINNVKDPKKRVPREKYIFVKKGPQIEPTKVYYGAENNF